ncbi:MAG: hypothetical protein JWQ00_958 [Noviherbaspirillum sp.]|nr:hypothetical protein [Noviherbaspirillum sp.]
MATIRMSTLEVQVDNTVYSFDTPHDADAFEACVATVDLSYCETRIRATGKRSLEQENGIPTTSLE